MKDVVKFYSESLNEKLNNLERERKREYEILFDELVSKEMVRSDIHVERALELETKFLKIFIEYAIMQFKKLNNKSTVDIQELGKEYRRVIDTFFSNSLKRMIGIINNVRGFMKEEFAVEHLNKIRKEALRKLEEIRELNKDFENKCKRAV